MDTLGLKTHYQHSLASISQPLNLALATAEDDTYPGDEELSQMDLSVIDNLTEHSSDSFKEAPNSRSSSH
jgi:hypothetical protein